MLPVETTILRSEDRAVRADGVAGRLVGCEMDRVKRIALRERILPLPAIRASLCEDRSEQEETAAKRRKKRKEKLSVMRACVAQSDLFLRFCAFCGYISLTPISRTASSSIA